jgi:hypothetical protein
MLADRSQLIEPAAIRAWVENRIVYMELHDGRIVGFPTARFKRLAGDTDLELQEVEIEGKGYALRWENVDKDFTVPGVAAALFEFPQKSR